MKLIFGKDTDNLLDESEIKTTPLTSQNINGRATEPTVHKLSFNSRSLRRIFDNRPRIYNFLYVHSEQSMITYESYTMNCIERFVERGQILQNEQKIFTMYQLDCLEIQKKKKVIYYSSEKIHLILLCPSDMAYQIKYSTERRCVNYQLELKPLKAEHSQLLHELMRTSTWRFVNEISNISRITNHFGEYRPIKIHDERLERQ